VLDRPSDIEARLREIDEAIIRLSERIDALEAAMARASETRVAAPGELLVPAGADLPAPSRPDLVGVLSLIGRTLIVFGGAYLLRALTESGRLPPKSGVLLGLIYALAWLGAADRAAGARRPVSSLFHGLAAVAIGLPLVWEAAARFHFFRPLTAAAALAVFTALALTVAWRRRLQSLAGVVTVGAIVAMGALAVGTDELPIYTLLVVLLGLATWGLGELLDWRWLAWPPAAAADVLLIALVARATTTPPLEAWDIAVGVQVVALGTYAVLVMLRTIGRRQPVGVLEIVQTAALLAIGLTGVVVIAHADAPSLLGWVGAGCLAGCAVAGLLASGSARGIGSDRISSDVNFHYYTTVALVLALAAAALLLAPPARAVVLAAAACATIWAAASSGRAVFIACGAVLSGAAALAAALPASTIAVWLGRPAGWPASGAVAWMVAIALGACAGVGCTSRACAPRLLAALARLAIAAMAVAAVGGLVVVAAGPAIAGVPPQPGILATVKTAYLAGAAVLLAFASRHPRWRELGWLAYPVLILGGLKLVLEDLTASRPSTLFIAFALYGTALVVTARLMRPRASST
jgi:hypothetical protein